MDPQRVREAEARCTQEQPPPCNAACPLHVDARALVERVRAGDLAGGFALFARYVPFPGILARTCHRPCEASCVRAAAGDAVSIGALERACAEHGGPAPRRRRLPPRRKRVAVVGAGLSGLAAAAELGAKGYDVEVFEAGPVALARLREQLPAAVVEAELAALPALGVQVRCESPVDAGGPSLAQLADAYAAVYLATGPGPLPGSLALAREADGRLQIAPLTHATSHPRVFAGGSHRYLPEPYAPLRSIQDGLHAATSIDRLLQGASLTARREAEGPSETHLHVDTRGLERSRAVAPSRPDVGYGPAEAAAEAARCLPCTCLQCTKACAYLAHYGSYPRRYVREIYNNDCIVLGAHSANRMVNSCTLCGLCAEVCPEKLSMAEVCLEARRSMVARGKMPPSAHAFALQDMEFSLSPAFALARHAPGATSSAVLFFPGCQLAGSSPDHVLAAYRELARRTEGGVGVLLGCCGVPARWAGREAQHQGVLASLRETWERMGRPRIVTACTTCFQTLREGLPGAEVATLWTAVALDGRPAAAGGARLAVHDPCTARGAPEIQAGVRRLLGRLGVEVVELNDPDRNPCCGFGGLVRYANPGVAEEIVRQRAAERAEDYVTYCAMCRDSFARQGKRAVHVLDLVFGAGHDPAARPDPGLSRRRENRARLKARLLREVFGEEVAEEAPPMRLDISPHVQAILERRMILVEDVERTIAHGERTGTKLEDPRTGHLLASHRPVEVTYWVEYAPLEGGGYVVHGAYSHRMQVS